MLQLRRRAASVREATSRALAHNARGARNEWAHRRVVREMIRYTPLGDSAITVTLGDGISRSLSADVLRVAEGLRAASLLGVTEIVPAYATIGVFYDPLRVNFDELRERLRPVVEQSRDAQTTTPSSATRTIRIPV